MEEHATKSVSNQMLIRKPAAEVFKAIRDPEITSRFWFSRGSAPLEEGKQVTWYWDMYEVSADVAVTELVENEKITFDWGDPKTTVEFEFIPISESSTYVTVRNFGFSQEGDELIEALIDTMGGFTFVLAGMKAWLEHGIALQLVADKYPPEVAAYFKRNS